MIRCAARPVTKVSPISSMRSTSVTTRKTPAAAKRTHGDPFATPLSSPVFTSTGPASVISPSTTTNTRPSEQRPAELAQQPQQAEVLVGSRLALEVDVGDVAHGSEARDAGEQLGCRGQVETPAARHHRRAPGRATERRSCDAGRAIAGSLAVAGPRRRGDAVQRRRSKRWLRALRCESPIAAASTSSSPDTSVRYSALRAMSSSWVPCFDHDAAVEHDDPVGEMQRRPAVRDRAAWCGRP